MQISLPEGHFVFTSESVNEGHPDKLCDQISDAVLDACLAQDPKSKVACETSAKGNMVMVFGEITTNAVVNYEEVVRNACKDIGYDAVEKGLDYKTFAFINYLSAQSPEIAKGVHVGRSVEEIGAGDQGHMFGYATNETEELMPMTHVLATRLGYRLTQVRKDGTCSWLRPDGKTQVTLEYQEVNGKMMPLKAHAIVISTQHQEGITNEFIAKELKQHVIGPVVPAELICEETKFIINPSGSFVVGGPTGDAGLTGRKIIIDTYGGWGAHGGGAFSGKDPSKVDRSGAYAGRWIAKSLVAAGLCERCLVQVSYAIGVARPLSVFVDSYGSVKNGKTDYDLLQIVLNNFDLRAGVISRDLDLQRPIYKQLAAYSHFGRHEIAECTWEQPKQLNF